MQAQVTSRKIRSVLAVVMTLALAPSVALAQQCTGDCNGNGVVTIDDLIVGVNIALGNTPADVCPAFQCGAAGEVPINCLVQGVGNALDGCPATPTPSTTASATATDTVPAFTASATPTATPTITETPTPTETRTATVPPVLRRASKSSAVAVTDDESIVVMVNPEVNTISTFNTATNVKLAEIDTDEQPVAVVLHPDNRTAFVANRAGASVVRVSGIDTSTLAVTATLAVGSEPTGLALSPTGARLFVAEWAEGRVLVVDTATMTALGSIEAPNNPRAVAVTNDGDTDDDDETLIVTEFFGEPNPDLAGCPAENAEVCDTGRVGRVRRYNLSDLSPQSPIVFAPLDSGFRPSTSPPETATVMTAPNQLYAAAVQGGKVYVTSVSASPEPPIDFRANVFPVLYVGDLASGTEDRSNVGTANLARLAFDQVPTRPRFLQEIVDLDFDGDSNVAYVVSRAADIVQRLTFDPAAGIVIGTDAVKQIDVAPDCQNPIGIAVASGLRRAYVNCWVSRRLGVIDLDSQSLTQTVPSALVPAPGTLEDDQNQGRRFYFTGRGRWSNDGDGYSSCGSCHPDGLSDGITWSFTAGPRQTTSMDGSFSHRPGPQRQRIFNWTGIFDEIHDFERNTRTVSGGLGAITTSDTDMCGNLAQEQPVSLPADGLGLPVKVVQDTTIGICTHNWDMIDDFVRTIRPPRGRRTLAPDAVARGAELFAGRAACTTCHAGPGFTAAHRFWTPAADTNDLLTIAPFQPPTADPFWSLNPFEISGEVASEGAMAVAPSEVSCGLRNVGSFGIPGGTAASEVLERRANGAEAEGRGGFNVPSLYGLSVGAPYLHHGQARTLDDLFSDAKWLDHLRAGNPELELGDGERGDLISYLYSIDASTAEPPLRDGFDGCPSEFPTFRGTLDGAQENPAVPTEASGSIILQLSPDRSVLSYELTIDGIDPADITQAHLHVAPRGFNGPVVLFLTNGPPAALPLRGTLRGGNLIPRPDVSVETFEDFLAALEAGDVYANVHTGDNPDGEIRAQIRAPITLAAALDGSQEVPAVVTGATATATLSLSADGQRLRYEVDVQGLTPDKILQAHLHVSPPGFNGPIVAFLAHAHPTLPLRGELTAADLLPKPEVGVTDFSGLVTALLAGDVYVNVHTEANPGGEVRGQVVPPTSVPATLAGDQETPPVVTAASGRARLTLNAEQTELRLALAVNGLTAGDIQQVDINVAPRGFAGPVVLIRAGGFTNLRMARLAAADLIPRPDAGILTFADFVAALRGGDAYVNVRTVAEPSGEIRGQVDAPTIFVTDLDGAQEVPPVSSTASGRARIVLDAEGTTLRFALAVSGLEDIQQAHIHIGPSDMNGEVAFFLADSSFTGPLVGGLTAADYRAPAPYPAFADFLDALRTGNTYVNVHTAAHGDGEIRGQVRTPLLFTAMLDGDQEVPPVTTAASGRGQVLISADRRTFRFALEVSDLPAENPIQMADIHVAPLGMNGEVSFLLKNGSFSGALVGARSAADLLATAAVPTYADFVAALLTGGAYMNVHTDDHEDGEIRGQLE